MSLFLQKTESELNSFRNKIVTDRVQISVIFNPDGEPYNLEEGGIDIIDTEYRAVEGGLDDPLQNANHLHNSD